MGSMAPLPQIERTNLPGSTRSISRIINGLWQLAGGHDEHVDLASAAGVMDDLIQEGFDTFDMADHYGDAELVVGKHNELARTTGNSKSVSFSKWCPEEDGVMSFENAEAAVDRALQRMGQERIELMQYHAWNFCDPTYLHNLTHLQRLQKNGKIGLIGLTNTDAAHLKLLLDSGFRIATNQVPTSVIDRRLTRGRLNDICLKHDVGILAYGTLLGGFLSEKWLDQPEPADDESKPLNWSLKKALDKIAKRHGVSISAVACRYVLDIPSVKAIIVGTRLTSDSKRYLPRNLETFSVELTEDDRVLIKEAQKGLTDVPGDCGDEYRRPPYLTASGDLSHHLSDRDRSDEVRTAIAKGQRVEYMSGSKWEPIAGYCRAVRTGNCIRVSGTTANSPVSSLSAIGGSSPSSQTVHILDIIEGALKAWGLQVSQAHGWVFQNAGVLPANTLVVSGLIGDEMLVEIEAEAEVGCADNGVVRVSNKAVAKTTQTSPTHKSK
ncbi:uncharacterized protein AB675_10725 [Cyphellophora attinorum]|uniref:NADP-dependent oxidoreductase domain-containing protein n=1 Tax=Cyphellophora attinorum TaxID=1664694 RepID=A0A0N1H594_9EURO|nr:uncharacterized protein AB675_10725 [Phialophora attinorum]KPI40770.1 hypothetical protein AB675_10725 [Phialophora attinorum]